MEDGEYDEEHECHGCFDSTIRDLYGSCEGCTGNLDFQLKCYEILRKIFRIENGNLMQENVSLGSKEEKFLKKLLKYNDEKILKKGEMKK